jgi:hypothetical protein
MKALLTVKGFFEPYADRHGGAVLGLDTLLLT